MKSLIKFAGLFFMFLCTLLVMMDIDNVTARKSEVEDALSLSMRNTLKASNISPMYEMDSSHMRSELIRSFAENINGDGTFEVSIYEADSKGILDVHVKETFLHNNQQMGEETLHRTMIVEDYPK